MNPNGSHWIRDARRLRIYARDGWCCLWCTRRVRRVVSATLDHFLPRARGGSNANDNLFTACRWCNERRQHQAALTYGTPEQVDRIVERLLTSC